LCKQHISTEDDSLRPEIEKKKRKRHSSKFRKESETGTFKHGSKVDVLVLDEQAGKCWLCAQVLKLASTRNSADRYKVKILSNGRITYKRSHEIKTCDHESIYQVGRNSTSFTTCVEKSSIDTRNPEICLNLGEEQERNDSVPILGDGVCRNPCNNIIPNVSTQEAIVNCGGFFSDEIVMFLNGQRLVLSVKSVAKM
jgi:hypothetical protein